MNGWEGMELDLNLHLWKDPLFWRRMRALSMKSRYCKYENTSLNCKDVTENVICIETLAKVASRQNAELSLKHRIFACHLQEMLYV